MRVRWFPCLAVFCLAAVAAPARAADDKTVPPTLTVRVRSVDDLLGYLVAAVRGQAVHVDCVAVGESHAPLIADPVLIASGDPKRFLGTGEQLLDSPALRVHNIGPFESLVHVVDDRERAARFLRVPPRIVIDLSAGGGHERRIGQGDARCA